MIGNAIAGFLLGPVAPATAAYESIATANGTGASGTITFSSIPSTYKHLQIRGIARSTEVATSNLQNMRLNGDTGSNYSSHQLIGNGAAASSVAYTAVAWMYGSEIPCNSALASTYNSFIIDILDYADTNKYKTIRTLGGMDLNGSGSIRLTSGNWRSTSAVTSFTLYLGTGNFPTATNLALYGIKGA
jgi:hypothetical protein